MAGSDTYWVLTFVSESPAGASAVYELLAGMDVDAVLEVPNETARSTVALYYDDREVAAEAERSYRKQLGSWRDFLPESVELLEPRELPREDWAESWKQYFHVQHISESLTVRPPWEAYSPESGEAVVVIDPGMCFGTGQHGTTVACLQFIDELANSMAGSSFMDMGCGSGILSIAAAKLGFRPVVAFDRDPDAVVAAQNNILANGMGGIVCYQRSLQRFEPQGRFRVVAANILAPLLVEHAGKIVQALAPEPPAYLLLAGILTEQYEDVRQTYARYGLAEHRRLTLDEWTSGCFVWQPGA